MSQFTEVMKRFMETSMNRPAVTTFRGDAVPAFDPSDRNQSAVMWCGKIDELRQLYRWDEDTTIYYALGKLKGEAELWYRGLGSLKFSWEDWKSKLTEAFPSQKNYHTLLAEMMRRTKRNEETYSKYFHDKAALLNACDIDGKRAVDCILGGIQDRVFVAGAKAGKHQTPQSLFEYISSMDTNSMPSTSYHDGQQRGKFAQTARQTTHGSRRFSKEKRVICFKCNKPGHYASSCNEKTTPGPKEKRCSYCKGRGHEEINCFRKKAEGNRKVAMLSIVDKDPDNKKYYKEVQINDSPSEAYIDFGSSCSIIRLHEAKRLGLKIKKEETVLRGYGNGKAVSMGAVDFRRKVIGDQRQ